MYKTLTTLFIILLLPFLVFAQDDNVLKDFAKRAVDLQSVRINEHLNVLQVTYDDNAFELVGINDQMQVLWRSSFKGYPFKSAKFKGNVVTIASSYYTLSKGTNNTYNAFLVDVSTGKLITQNQISSNADTYEQFPDMFTGDGSFCKVIIRQSALVRKPPISYLFDFSSDKTVNTTTDLQTFELNDKLEVKNSFKPEIDEGIYMRSTINNKGDLFVSWLNNTTVEVYKYENGKTVLSKKLFLDIPITGKKGEKYNVAVFPNEEDRNVFYYAMIYKNKDKDPELNIGKFDFSTGKSHFITEAFIKKDLKTMEKSFVTVNKKINDPYLGLDSIELKYVKELNGKLVVATASYTFMSYNNIPLTVDFALLINSYDTDLNQKFQQLMPVKSTDPYLKLYNGYHIANDKLYIVSNYTSGTFNSHGQALNILDLNSGSWDKMEILSKKHVNNSDFSAGDGIMWFTNNYIVPYCDPKSMVSLTRSEITLQLNQY